MKSVAYKTLKNVPAVIMAGGEGRRLYPLTGTRPKPLVDVCGESALARTFSLLSAHGVCRAAVTTAYMSEMIEAALGNGMAGIGVVCVKEEKPLGTAGGVRSALSFLPPRARDILIMSADTVCETDLSRAYALHVRRGADATMVIRAASDPSEYGIVLGDFSGGDGMIRGFIEKPPASLLYSGMINCGIYIVRRELLCELPEGVVSDFGRDFFPQLLSRGLRLLGAADSGYWCDIGSPPHICAAALIYRRGTPVRCARCLFHARHISIRRQG